MSKINVCFKKQNTIIFRQSCYFLHLHVNAKPIYFSYDNKLKVAKADSYN